MDKRGCVERCAMRCNGVKPQNDMREVTVIPAILPRFNT